MLEQPDPQDTPTYRAAIAAGAEHLAALEEARAELQRQLAVTMETLEYREAIAELAALVVERDRARADAATDPTIARELQADAEWLESRLPRWHKDVAALKERERGERQSAARADVHRIADNGKWAQLSSGEQTSHLSEGYDLEPVASHSGGVQYEDISGPAEGDTPGLIALLDVIDADLQARGVNASARQRAIRVARALAGVDDVGSLDLSETEIAAADELLRTITPGALG